MGDASRCVRIKRGIRKHFTNVLVHPRRAGQRSLQLYTFIAFLYLTWKICAPIVWGLFYLHTSGTWICLRYGPQMVLGVCVLCI